MKAFKIALALGVGVSVVGAALAQAPKPAAAPAPNGAPSGPSVPGVSPQGNAVIARIQKQGDPQGQAAVQKLRAILPQVSQTALAPTVDVDKFGALLKQQDAITAEIQQRRTEMMVTILRQLPPADRGPFLRAIATKVPTGQPAPAPAR